MKTPIIIAFILLVSLVTNAQAGFSMAEYRRLKNDKQFELYLAGFLNGVSWANAVLGATKQPSLFCEPPTLALNLFNLKQIVDDYWEQKKHLRDETMDFGAIALSALQETFPCK